MRARGRKGQNAVEFLITYSWALLIIAIVIAILLVMGLPSVRGGEPERCAFGAGSLGCERLAVASVGGEARLQQLNITNNFNQPIYVCGVYCSAEATGSDGLPATKVPTSFNGACGGAPSPVARIDPGRTGVVASNQIIRGSLFATGCFDSSGSVTSPPVGSMYRGRLYLIYSYADETAASGAKPHVSVADAVARVVRS